MIFYQNIHYDKIKQFVGKYHGDEDVLSPVLHIIGLKHSLLVEYDEMLDDIEIWINNTNVFRSTIEKYGMYDLASSEEFFVESIHGLANELKHRFIK